jgi:hypothetical protein
MVSCTTASSRATTLLSCAPQAQVVAPTALRRGWQASATAPVFASFQGGAIAATGTAPVIDLMVTDHQYSTRLGPSSCSPPV